MKFTNVNLLLSATAVVTTAPLIISAQAPCPAPWVLNSVYDEGDQVTSFDNLNVTNNIYECNAWPFNHLCGQSGFQPGSNDIGPGPPQNDPEPAWKMAWTLVGGCSRTPPDIKPFDPSRRYYEAGEIVTNKGKKWRCRVWPYSWRCHQDGYEPGEDFNGYPLYEEAWEELLPTNAPSIASSNVPSESPSNVPSESPSNKPSLSPSESPSNAPSESSSNVPSTSAAPSNTPSLTPSESQSNVPSTYPSESLSSVPSTSAEPSSSPPPSNVPSVSAAPSCQNQLNGNGHNICFAIDESGSVCDNNYTCPLGPNTQCCPNFVAEIEFAKSLVTALEPSGAKYSIVTFSQSSTIDQQLSADPDATLTTLDDIVYGFGGTYHHRAIDACQSTFASADPADQNTIVLITDGLTSQQALATDAATSAKAEGTNIVPVYISLYPVTEQTALNYLKQVSSTDTVVKVDTFDDLPSIFDIVLTEVACS